MRYHIVVLFILNPLLKNDKNKNNKSPFNLFQVKLSLIY
ncbi:hypothetical protein HPHPP1_1186 [Helicobacter pylori Hp P-1]|nr:hypothetical protein HPHPP1_1186 [Helicobacter pylori Hp P-1]EJC20444.1 hypothetical protein HPHPP1B_1268 [Helicobacter pylori Hp P-1b]